MFVLSRFQSKLTLVFVALFLIVQAAIFAVFISTSYSQVNDRVQEILIRSGRLFERIIASRSEHLWDTAALLGQNDGIRSALSDEVKTNLSSALSTASVTVGLKAAALLDEDGRVMASFGLPRASEWSETAGRLREHTFLRDEFGTLNPEHTAITEVIGGRLYIMAHQPIRTPTGFGWLLIAEELDKSVAEDVKSLTSLDLDVAFVFQAPSSQTWQLGAATDYVFQLNQYIERSGDALMSENAVAFWNGTEFTLHRVALPHTGGDHKQIALLYMSQDAALAPYYRLAYALGGIVIVGLVVLTFGTYVIAQGVSRPLNRLAEASNMVAEGAYTDLEKALPKEDRGEVGALARGFKHMISAVREREEHITRQVMFDQETSLPSRATLEAALQPHIKKAGPFYLMFMRVENLDVLKGAMDHEYLSAVYTGIADRLSSSSDLPVCYVGEGMFSLVRFGEFDPAPWAEMVAHRFEKSILAKDVVVDVRVGMGIVHYPLHGSAYADLMRCASAAMDQVRSRNHPYSVYDAKADEARRDQLSMMGDLRRGLEQGEMSLAYQPKLDLADGRVHSVEALVRWTSPTRGFVPPDSFIPLAERTGEIRHVTHWVLEEAIKQIADWKRQHLHLQVGVNISSWDVMDKSLPIYIASLLARFGVSARQLYLEITESDVMEDLDRAMEVMRDFAQMGIRLAVDDYGAGYSSLTYLRRLPVKELKIDKSFVMKLATSQDDRILVRSTVDLGHNLGLKVTAEGVEDEKSLQYLSTFGCDHVQGYHISRPVPAREVPSVVRTCTQGLRLGA